MKVGEKMTKNMVTVNITATAAEAAKKMQSEKVGTVLVLDGWVLKGLVTDRQIATRVVASGKDPAKVGVSEFMTKNPVTVSPEMDIHEAVRVMGAQGYRRIPVLEGEKLVGIISVADIAEHAQTCNLCMQNIFKELKKAER
ncbi:MAG: CBS domain-containing protein [Methanotrichaceae archaeon]|nr:CBS domain-containing protein [Methanotrichaceae archaeon]